MFDHVDYLTHCSGNEDTRKALIMYCENACRAAGVPTGSYAGEVICKGIARGYDEGVRDAVRELVKK